VRDKGQQRLRLGRGDRLRRRDDRLEIFKSTSSSAHPQALSLLLVENVDGDVESVVRGQLHDERRLAGDNVLRVRVLELRELRRRVRDYGGLR